MADTGEESCVESDLSDLELLERWREHGDERSIRALLRRYQGELTAYLKTSVGDYAPDLTNLVWGQLAKVASSSQVDNFKALMFRIARCRVTDHWRRESRSWDLNAEPAQNLESMFQALARKREAKRLLRALRVLRAERNELAVVIAGRYWYGLGDRVLADTLGIPEGTAKGRIRAAHLRLEKILAHTPEQVTSTLQSLTGWAREQFREAKDFQGGEGDLQEAPDVLEREDEGELQEAPDVLEREDEGQEAPDERDRVPAKGDAKGEAAQVGPPEGEGHSG